MSVLKPELRIGDPGPGVDGRAEVVQRVLTVLSTRPGILPWRPDFGTALDDLLGQPASPTLLNEAEWRVRDAMARWMPDTPVLSCRAEAVLPPQRRMSEASPGWDPERGLLALGGEAELRVHLVLETTAGPLALSADVEV